MSIETLLLVIFFVVAPLIEAFRAARRRTQQRPPDTEQTRPVPVRRPPPPAVQTEPPEWTAGPVLPPERSRPPELPVIAAPSPQTVAVPQNRQNMSDKIAARRRLAHRDAAAESALESAARERRRARSLGIAGLRTSGGLRRVMVSMAILGPCRAVDPHGWRRGML